jgi:hypothetical protein
LAICWLMAAALAAAAAASAFSFSMVWRLESRSAWICAIARTVSAAGAAAVAVVVAASKPLRIRASHR